MMNVQVATEGEVNELTKAMKTYGVSSLVYNYDDEDNIGFVYGKVHIGNSKVIIVQFQDRGEPCFASFSIGMDRYDISYPEGELKKILNGLTQSAKEKRGMGLSLKEKMYGKTITTVLKEDEPKEDEMIMTESKFVNDTSITKYVVITFLIITVVGIILYAVS